MASSIRHLCTKKIVGLKLIKSTIPSIVSTNCRAYTSTLFVPGNKASQVFVYVAPDVDCSDRFSDIEKLQNELGLRGTNINAQELFKTWEYYQYVLSNKECLEEKVSTISKQLAEIYKIENPPADILKKKETLVSQNQLNKKDLKAMKEVVWELEESLMPQILKLPNKLDERTPPDTAIVLKTVKEKPNVSKDKKQSHLDIGKRLGLIDYRNPVQFYLSDEAAFFELETLDLVGRVLIENNFQRCSAPDFCRSLIVEGAGLDHENVSSTFILQEHKESKKETPVQNLLHLVGGASLPALLATCTKRSCKPESLPMRVFSSGRQYAPIGSAGSGLFSACQSSAVQVLILVGKNDHEAELQRLIRIANDVYDALGKHYRYVFRPARELELSESLRLSIEMWSVHEDRYIEVGHISLSGDYFAKRLMIAQQPRKECLYPAAISGTLISVPRVLGCLIEEHPDKFVLPEKLANIFA